ncbi:MAG TPA: MMPL family transporter [Spirochaetota bacterium]|nr:MMPL family transporter [Spirochaetota bacterium]HSA15946.1 MMPL family transporter [Spirochaetota bacterium]
MDEKAAQRIASHASNYDIDELLRYIVPPIKDLSSIVDADYIEGTGKSFIVKKLHDEEDPDDASVADLKRKVDSWPFYKGGLISYDDKLAVILVRLSGNDKVKRATVFHETEQILKKMNRPGVKLYLDGESVIADTISDFIISDISMLLPLVILIVMIALYFSFRNLQGVLFPMSVVLIASVWSVGFMSYCKAPINLISTTMPVLLIAVGSAYGIHYMNHYLLSPIQEKFEVIRRNMVAVGIAILMAGLTTVAGFGSLATSGFVPIKNFGIYTAVGVFFCIILAMYVMPSMLLVFPVKKKIIFPENERNDLVHAILSRVDGLVKKRYNAIIIFSVIIACIFAYGMTRIEVDVNNIAFFKKNSEIRIADDRLNEKLAGTQVLSIVLESRDGSPILRPELLQRIDSYESGLMKRFTIVKKVVSVNPYLKKMNQEMFGDQKYYTLPETEQKINDYLLLYSGDLDPVITKSRDSIRISISMICPPTIE